MFSFNPSFQTKSLTAVLRKGCRFLQRSAFATCVLALGLGTAPSTANTTGYDAYFQGIGAASAGDDVNARALFAGSCEAGWPAGCDQLALMLAEGEGGPADEPRARAMMSARCLSGESQMVCSTLGEMLRDGRGGPVDLATAREAFRGSCEGGASWGCYDFANMLVIGEGGPQDLESALPALDYACNWEHAAGCHLLGVVIRRLYGPDREADTQEAFRRSCAYGDQRGCDALAGLQ